MQKRHHLMIAAALAAVGVAIGGYLSVAFIQQDIPTAPLVLDLDGDGVELGNAFAYFDMDRDGYAERSNWVSPDDGFLVLDGDDNGVVTDITELLGTGGAWNMNDLKRDLGAGRLTSGFNMLRAWDENGDGAINEADTVFRRLRVWRDLDEDGVSQPSELQTLSAAGVAALTISAAKSLVARNKNAITASGRYSRPDGTIREVISVRFGYDANITRFLGPINVDPATEALPKLLGWGEAKPLSAAMTDDQQLRAMVTEFTQLTVADAPDLEARIEAIMLRWYGAEDISPTSRGPNIDGRVITAWERLHGTPWSDAKGSSNPDAKAGNELVWSWQDTIGSRMVRLLAQVRLGQTLFPGLQYKAMAFTILPDGLSLRDALDNLRAHSPADPAAKLRYWRSMILALDDLYGEFKETVPKEAQAAYSGRFNAEIDEALAADGVPYSGGEIRSAKRDASGKLVFE